MQEGVAARPVVEPIKRRVPTSNEAIITPIVLASMVRTDKITADRVVKEKVEVATAAVKEVVIKIEETIGTITIIVIRVAEDTAREAEVVIRIETITRIIISMATLRQ